MPPQALTSAQGEEKMLDGHTTYMPMDSTSKINVLLQGNAISSTVSWPVCLEKQLNYLGGLFNASRSWKMEQGELA
jgi:hypothetical protein